MFILVYCFEKLSDAFIILLFACFYFQFFMWLVGVPAQGPFPAFPLSATFLSSLQLHKIIKAKKMNKSA